MVKTEKTARVRVFRNLHFKQRAVWSVLQRVQGSWLLLLHTPSVLLLDAKFVVQAAGRERVRRERRKSVHAFVEGDLVVNPCGLWRCQELVSTGVRVTYDPYKHEQFVVHPALQALCGCEVRVAAAVWLTTAGRVYAEL